MWRLLGNRRILAGVVVIAGLLAVALWPATVPVEVEVLSRGPLIQTVDDEGMTRVRNRFVVSVPVAGRVLRVELEPGDPVKRGAVVARVRAETPSLLDARSRSEAEAALATARAALGRAQAEEQRARTTAAQSGRDLARLRRLAADGVVAPQGVESAEATSKAADEAVDAAVFAVGAAQADVRRAQARLMPSRPETEGRVIAVISPVDGVVLKRLRESESVVPAGEPIVEIGDPGRLEIVADLLSTDAVRVSPGTRAIVEQWGGTGVLDAVVRRVEPSGFTKVSALGVEEQRVNVVLDFANSAQAWKALGDAYRVEVRIVIWESADVLKVPTGALFREGAKWAVYVVDDARAHKRVVELGHQTGQEAEVLAGLSAGQVVVLHPGDAVTDDAKVAIRSTE